MESNREDESETTFEKDGIIYSLNDTAKTASIHNTNSLSGDIIIPRSVFYSDHEYVIKSIDAGAFQKTNILSIRFSEDSELEIIEQTAFSESRIESLTIPSSVTKLKDGWCHDTKRLTKVTISPNNKYFKNHELNDNLVVGRISEDSTEFNKIIFASRSIESITIPSNIQNIGSCAFQFTQIEQILIPSHVKKISNLAFANTFFLQEVKFEKDSELEIIGNASFYVTKISSFFVPPNVNRIGKSAFNNCQKLEDIQFAPDSKLQIIDEDAFQFANLKTVSIPKNVTIINKGAFSFSKNLTNIIFSQDSELVTLGPENFSETSVNHLTIPPKVTNFNITLLENIQKITIMPNNEYMKNYELDENLVVRRSSKDSTEFDEIIFLNRNAQEVTIPLNIKKIAPFAFGNCIINSISIPPHLKEICECAFYKCINLQNIEIPRDSELQIIGKYAFDRCSFQTIYIPPNVEHIYENTFCGCKNLITVEFANDSKLQTIENYAFKISSIESLTIPSEVYDISGIFTLSNLKQLTIMPNNRYFKNDESDKNLVIGRSSKESLEFDELIFVSANEKYVTIPSNIKTINQGAFSKTSISDIFIPSNVTKIDGGAFHRCSNLRRVEFAQDSQISNIENSCFMSSSVEIIKIPSSVTKISNYAFNYCMNLKAVLIPYDSKLEIIDEHAFSNSSIKSLFIPSSLKTIGHCAFLSCSIGIIEFESHKKHKIKLFIDLYQSNTIYMIPNK